MTPARPFDVTVDADRGPAAVLGGRPGLDVLFEIAGYFVTIGGDRVVVRPPETDG